MQLERVCVYAASSHRAPPVYLDAAERLGRLLAREGVEIVYGGGAAGLMGALADGALAESGRVVGILPEFMGVLEWGHERLTELRLVGDMHARKRAMIAEVDGVVALPGGCGTLEELFEAITWKRLGLHTRPIVLVNVEGFFDPCVALLERAISDHFMDDRHRDMWSVVASPEAVLPAIRSAPAWSEAHSAFAVPGSDSSGSA
jgi:uncharacterized protein (TIGR00730 family)